jgi:hypothetical protein
VVGACVQVSKDRNQGTFDCFVLAQNWWWWIEFLQLDKAVTKPRTEEKLGDGTFARKTLIIYFINFFLLFLVLGFEFRTSLLLGTLVLGPWLQSALFALVILEIDYCFLPKPIWTVILLFYASHCSWDERHMPPHPAFFPLRWGLVNFCKLAWNHDPLDLSLPSS